MAIEFVILFPLFLLIFYAIVSYSIAFVTLQQLHSLSSEAARVALSVERQDGSPDESAIASVIDQLVLDRDPRVTRDECRDGNGLLRGDGDGNDLAVCLRIGKNDFGLPTLTLPGIVGGISIPSFRDDELRSESKIRL